MIQKLGWNNVEKLAEIVKIKSKTEVLKGEREVIKRAHTIAPRTPKRDRILIHAVNVLISLR